MTASRAAWCAGIAALGMYVATLAPSVTFWDSGEFIAAAKVVGIPHPPGTPLFVALLASAGKLLAFLPFAVATNLLSAASTAAAVVVTGCWLGRAGIGWRAGVAALTAGAMSSVWQNATETEVYASSLLLSVCMIAAADRAGRSSDRRWLVLTAYLVGLSLPLHLSAMVAAPVAIFLVTQRADGERDWAGGLALTGLSAVVVAVARGSPWLGMIGALVLGAGVRIRGARRKTLDPRTTVLLLGVTAAAVAGLLFLLIRARFDPAINQGNPVSLAQLDAVVARRQYDVAGIWPRRAPIWLQLANWFEYADWQFALSLAPSVIPGIGRVVVTLCFACLGLVGASWHKRADRRTWMAVLLLLVCGSLGVIAYLNLRAGASFAWSIIPDTAGHEARDRDYFFVLAFWAWGIWAGLGALAAAARLRLPVWSGIMVALCPIALNWTAVNRRSEPEASLPLEVARSLLSPLPAGAVLFVAGDNDTYPLWYAQQVQRLRRDVTVVTMPLLAAPWYEEELTRRAGLRFRHGAQTLSERASRVATAVRLAGRPLAVALTVTSSDRRWLGSSWRLIGTSALSTGPGVAAGAAFRSDTIALDSNAVRRAVAAFERWRGGRSAHEGLDPANDYFMGLLTCPRLALQPRPSSAQLASLDSLCNLR